MACILKVNVPNAEHTVSGLKCLGAMRLAPLAPWGRKYSGWKKQTKICLLLCSWFCVGNRGVQIIYSDSCVTPVRKETYEANICIDRSLPGSCDVGGNINDCQSDHFFCVFHLFFCRCFSCFLRVERLSVCVSLCVEYEKVLRVQLNSQMEHSEVCVFIVAYLVPRCHVCVCVTNWKKVLNWITSDQIQHVIHSCMPLCPPNWGEGRKNNYVSYSGSLLSIRWTAYVSRQTTALKVKGTRVCVDTVYLYTLTLFALCMWYRRYCDVESLVMFPSFHVRHLPSDF